MAKRRKKYVICRYGEAIAAGTRKEMARALGVDAVALQGMAAGRIEMAKGFSIEVVDWSQWVNVPIPVRYVIRRSLLGDVLDDCMAAYDAEWECPHCSAANITLTDIPELAMRPEVRCEECGQRVWLDNRG